MSNIIPVNDSNFDQEVLNSDTYVLVDFHATWCSPCKRLHPIVEKFADENIGKVKVCEVDIEEAEQITSKYNIRSVPTLIVFKDGKVFNSKIGLATLPQIYGLLA